MVLLHEAKIWRPTLKIRSGESLMAMNEMLAPRLLHLDVIRFIPFKEFTDRLPQAYLKLAVQLTQKLDLTGHTKGAA